MRCLFCKEGFYKSKKWTVLSCPKCDAYYHFDQYAHNQYNQHVLEYFGFSTVHNDMHYCATFYLNPSAEPSKFVVSCSDGHGYHNKPITLDYHPTNLTPFNFREKLPLLLTFS